jgi:hypothetical protein
MSQRGCFNARRRRAFPMVGDDATGEDQRDDKSIADTVAVALIRGGPRGDSSPSSWITIARSALRIPRRFPSLRRAESGGITDALRNAELLSRAVARNTEAALSEYQETRDRLSSALFGLTDEIAGYQWDLDSVKDAPSDERGDESPGRVPEAIFFSKRSSHRKPRTPL